MTLSPGSFIMAQVQAPNGRIPGGPINGATPPPPPTIALERERVKCLLLINTQLMKKALKVYNNQGILNTLEPRLRQQVIELYQNCTKRLHCNLLVLTFIYEKYHDDIATASSSSSTTSTNNKASFPVILSPPPDMPELNQLYQKLQELYPEAVQYLKMRLLQWKRAQQDMNQPQANQIPLQQHSPPPSLTGRANQQQQHHQQQIPPTSSSNNNNISSPQITSQMPSTVQRQMSGQFSQQHTPIMTNSPLYKNTPSYIPPKQSQQQLPMVLNPSFNPSNTNSTNNNNNNNNNNGSQSFKHINQQQQPMATRRSISSAQNTPISTMLPQQILQQASSMTPNNDGFGGNTDDTLGGLAMGGFLNFNPNEGMDISGGMTSSYGDSSVNTMLLMNDMMMTNGGMMD
ncbi:uncharacterized protein KQ657_001597 [Scheffersomyces spartinae]|uniref:Uncharacterized protein n=1 Tax=Scheffersomyces spartinae TaxID=45513 RepID=A0A9P7V774_9ASCO|nr:uncharacterized protein KQ657_001597 [Scheffersomyces spartinae]KAG7192502.1 hypothetical protein KQ657_001597 [Scheffersomyces spartinae]